jgi:hypothetical protein
VLRATPKVISLIDLAPGPGEPELAHVGGNLAVHRVHNSAHGPGERWPHTAGAAGGDESELVRFLGAGDDVYRPGAPL